ncbi:lactocepin [Clostridium cavendishii DSM 21758]|uniref:Lactocepin n=1 Tax=Clostridium cavendishii DSM 21758 TaxID=1121302 RepID=A0A1M6GUY0_9CLOT|nr:S8 family serine peptidase [Clostridium cavendishii]SHJ13773.1 lactocepin [Clostridium cavendishii DSM 21758]
MKKQKLKIVTLMTAFSFCSSVAAGAVTTTEKTISDEEIRQAFTKNLSEQVKAEERENYNKVLESLGVKAPTDINETKLNVSEKIKAIVQLEDAPAIKSGQSEEAVKAAQANIIAQVELITGTKVRKNFGYLVNGFSIEATRGDLEKIGLLSGVKNVKEARVYYPDMTSADQITKAVNVWKNNNYKGEGLVVSIIDTGIDYTHKDFKNINTNTIKLHKEDTEKLAKQIKKGKYFTDKIPFGYNYADGNNEVSDSGNQHGMHVAGIVGANGNDEDIDAFNAIKGVAPEAQLLAMKVFSSNPENHGANDEDTITAIEDSVKLGADIVNMSLGSSGGFMDKDEPVQVAVKNATDNGVLCVISAGNAQTAATSDGWGQPANLLGLKDTGIVGTPGTSEDALTVASMENSKVIFNSIKYTTAEGDTKVVRAAKGLMTSLDVFKNYNELVDCGIGDSKGFEGKDLKGKIALIKRGGGITFDDKSKTAEKCGAIGIVFYNHETGGDVPVAGTFGTEKVPGFMVGLSDGNEIFKLVKSGKNKIKFELEGGLSSFDNADINDMSQYSSWGLTPSLDIKPEITAPGGDIYSLAYNNGYQYMSGTSMASPHTAGGEALIIQSIKKRGLKVDKRNLVTFAKNTAINTAVPMKDKFNNTIPYSPRRQGAGLLQLDKAVTNNVILTNSDGKPTAALREIGKNSTFTLTLRNYGSTDASYVLDKEPILSEITNEKGAIKGITVDGADLDFSNKEVTVKAGEEAKVTVKLNLSDNVKIDNFIEGFVKFNSKDDKNPNLSIPFVGYYGDWSKEQIVDAPAYDINSKVRQTLLLTTYPDNVVPFFNSGIAAISPNGDDYFDKIVPSLYFLRNAKELDVDIVDANGNSIRDLYKENNIKKNAFEEFIKGTKRNKILSLASWNGTIYNKATGNYEPVKDGQYYYTIKTKVDLPNAKEQTIKLPIKIDTVAPKVEIVSLNKDANNKYILKWKSNDDFSGVNSNVVFINGKVIKGKPVAEAEDLYSQEVTNVVENGVNNVLVSTLDNAFNIGKDSKDLKVGTIENVFINNLKDGQFISSKALIDNKLNIFGGVADSVEKLYINSEAISLEGKYFNYSCEPKVGENTLEVKALGKDDKEIYKKDYKFTYDNVSPELTINEPKLVENEYNYLKEKTLTFKGTAKDTNLLAVQIVNAAGKVLSQPQVKEDGSFEATINLTNDLDTITVLAADKAINITKKSYIITTKEKVQEPFAIKFSNLSAFQVVPATDTRNDIYTVKGTVNKKVVELKIAGENVTVNDDLTFSKDIKLVQGSNRITIYAKAETGEVYESLSRVMFDSKLPNIKLNNVNIRKDGNIYTNNDSITIKGEASDNLYGFTLKINGDIIFNYNRYPSQDPSVLKKDFEKTINLSGEQTKVKIELTDFFGNTNVEDLNVILDKVVPNKPTIKLNPETVTNREVIATIASDETKLDSIEYSFDGKNYFKYTEPLKVAASTDIHARAIDYAGNVSEEAISKVEIDTVAPEIKISGVEDGGIYKAKVTPIVTTDDKDATIEMKLNGQKYDGSAIDVANKYKLEITVKDKAENVSTKTVNFEVKQLIVVNTNGQDAEAKIDGIKSVYENILIEAQDATNSKVIINSESLSKDNKNLILNSKNVGVVLPISIINDQNIKATTLEVKEVTDLKDANKGFKFLGKVYNFDLTANMKDGSTKNIKTFGDTPVRLSFKLTPEEAKNLDVSKLNAFYYDESNKTWVALNNGNFDKDTLIYSFDVVHFSKYTIGVKESTSNGGNGTSNGNVAGASTANTSNSGNIIKTGSPVATKVIVVTGLGLMAIGTLAVVYGKRKRVK